MTAVADALWGRITGAVVSIAELTGRRALPIPPESIRNAEEAALLTNLAEHEVRIAWAGWRASRATERIARAERLLVSLHLASATLLGLELAACAGPVAERLVSLGAQLSHDPEFADSLSRRPRKRGPKGLKVDSAPFIAEMFDREGTGENITAVIKDIAARMPGQSPEANERRLWDAWTDR
jgi:hypothetical protein